MYNGSRSSYSGNTSSDNMSDSIISSSSEDSIESDTTVISVGSSNVSSLDTHYPSYLQNTRNSFNTILNQISREERRYRESRKIHNAYYIGIAVKTNSYRHDILMSTVISAQSFLKYNFQQIIYYLKRYSLFIVRSPRIHIMQLKILGDGSYSVILKTFWIRLIQRKWKTIFKKRKELLYQRMQLKNLRNREITGRHLYGLNVLPGLYGMLCNSV